MKIIWIFDSTHTPPAGVSDYVFSIFKRRDITGPVRELRRLDVEGKFCRRNGLVLHGGYLLHHRQPSRVKRKKIVYVKFLHPITLPILKSGRQQHSRSSLGHGIDRKFQRYIEKR